MSELVYILVLGIIAYTCFKASRGSNKVTEQVMDEIRKDKELGKKFFKEINS